MGIDYGRGIVNIDTKTDIRYGVISMHSVTDFWCDESTPYICKNTHWNDETLPYEAISYYIDNETYKAETCLDSDIIITKSPYYTYCNFCSPCVPGAGNINDKSPEISDNDCRAFCFGHEAYENGNAGFAIFDVKTNQLILPKE